MFRTFEFFSILQDKDEQDLDSLFGLGISPPGHSLKEGYMSIVEWMKESGFIKKKVASIYLPNFDGTGRTGLEEKLNLPGAHIRFGDYNTTAISKDNEIYFWKSTSTYNWTLDLVEIQFGSHIYDIDGNERGKSSPYKSKNDMFRPQNR